jgi:hypothetical protein
MPVTMLNQHNVDLAVASEQAAGKCTPFVSCPSGNIYDSEQQFNVSEPKTVLLSVAFSGGHVDEKKNVTLERWICSYNVPPDTLLKGFKQVTTAKLVRGAVDQVTIKTKLAMPITCSNIPFPEPGQAPAPLPNCNTTGLIVGSQATCDAKKFKATRRCAYTSDVSVSSDIGGSCYPDNAASSVMAVVECDNGKRYEFSPYVYNNGISWGRTILTPKT